MGEEGKSFGAIVVASLAIIIGSKYLVTAMVVQMSRADLGIPMLLDSTLVTGLAGGALVLVAGGFISAVFLARPAGLLTFAAVALLNKPWVGAVEPIVIGEVAMAVVAVLYLALYNPINRTERTEVDESTSATRIGSTIR